MATRLTIDIVRDGETLRRLVFDSNHRKLIKIGRLSTSDIPLNDREASRFHAAIHLSSREAMLADMKSSGGCTLNGRPAGREPLRSGDQIQIGRSTLIVGLESLPDAVGVPHAEFGAPSPPVGGHLAAQLVRLSPQARAELQALMAGGAGPVPPASVAVDRDRDDHGDRDDDPTTRDAWAHGDGSDCGVPEKYNTLHLVTQMRRQRHRSWFFATALAGSLLVGLSALAGIGQSAAGRLHMRDAMKRLEAAALSTSLTQPEQEEPTPETTGTVGTAADAASTEVP